MNRLWLALFALLLFTACENKAKEKAAAVPAQPPANAVSESPLPSSKEGTTAVPGDSSNEPSAAPLPEWTKDVDLATVNVRDEVTRLKEVMKETRDTFMERYKKASKEDQVKMRDEFPKPETFVAHAERLVAARPDDPDISAAYAFMAAQTPGEAGQKFVDVLFEKYLNSVDMKELYVPLTRGKANSQTEERLNKMIESGDEEVRGVGTFALAEYLAGIEQKKELIEKRPELADRIGDAEYLKTKEIESGEVEKLYRTALEKYAKVDLMGKDIGQRAGAVLFELEHLSVGKEAPAIEGKDMDGVAFSLTEYRGKVVMLDFWGDW